MFAVSWMRIYCCFEFINIWNLYMNLHWIDWTIIIGITAFFSLVAYATKRYVKTTADFLAANRCAGRYLLTFSEAIAGLGLITVLAYWQLNLKVGFAQIWWTNLQIPIMIIITLTGYVIYRYRETRVLTLGQFFEVRYSYKFRIFAACICWLSGITNYGIFPAVGANFFIYFCNLSEHYTILGFSFSTYYSLIIGLMAIALYFTFMGGQVTILITDFLQSMFCNVVLMAVTILLLIKYPLSDVFESLLNAPDGQSMVNPFNTGRADFTPFYFIVIILNSVINRLAWQGHQGYYCSAISPHETKMAGVLAQFRAWGFTYALIFVPIVAYMIMHHANYTAQADQVTGLLSRIENEQIRDQMLVPMTMTTYLPVGLLGAFAAVMLAAFISTNDTMLHSWGSIFVQDILIPLRKKPLSNAQHLWALRLSIIFVAIFVCIFSVIFNQTEHILYFMALTGAIWLGGIGVVITFGLYTSWGKNIAAFAALICGATLSGGGLIWQQLWQYWYGTGITLPTRFIYIYSIILGITAPVLLGKIAAIRLSRLVSTMITLAGLLIAVLVIIFIETGQPVWALSNTPWSSSLFIINGQHIFFFAIVTSIELYTLISLSGKRHIFNLDKMLHRGKYRIAADHADLKAAKSVHADKKFNIRKVWGINEDFTLGDKVIYGLAFGQSMIFFLLFAGITIIILSFGLGESVWGKFFYYVFCFSIAFFFIVTVWLSIGGFRDLIKMLKSLGTKERDISDDGRVVDHDYERESAAQLNDETGGDI
jgi:SSS family solute:Na+ symporter